MSLVGLLVISPLLLAVLLLTPHHINYQPGPAHLLPLPRRLQHRQPHPRPRRLLPRPTLLDQCGGEEQYHDHSLRLLRVRLCDESLSPGLCQCSQGRQGAVGHQGNQQHQILGRDISQVVRGCRLVPDMTFMIGPLEETTVWNKKKEKADILFVLRTDQHYIVFILCILPTNCCDFPNYF